MFPLAGSFNLHRAGHGGDVACPRTHVHLTKLSLSAAEPCAWWGFYCALLPPAPIRGSSSSRVCMGEVIWEQT